jgi:hypothetical protein
LKNIESIIVDVKMDNSSIRNKVILKDCPKQNSLSYEELSSKLHQCSFGWSDKCAHCEIDFDELKQKISYSIEPTDDNSNELRMKKEECLAKLEG